MPFTTLVGCDLPIQLAGMGGISTPALAGAVSEAGALGMVDCSGKRVVDVIAVFDELAGLTDRPFGGNFLMPFLDEDAVVLAAGRCRLIEFFYGDPVARLVDTVHRAGALAAWQVGSVDEARAAADAGCDLVVAQGVEAGGHVRGTTAMLPLVGAVVDAVDLPIVAAGGIGDGSVMAAAMAAGASAVRIGTRFVAADESAAHPRYVEALVAATPDDTVLTTAFSFLWPDAPHRVLASCVEALEAFEGDAVGEATVAGARVSLPPGAIVTPDVRTTGMIEAMPLYAGRSVGAVRGRQPARQIVDELMSTAQAILGSVG